MFHTSTMPLTIANTQHKHRYDSSQAFPSSITSSKLEKRTPRLKSEKDYSCLSFLFT